MSNHIIPYHTIPYHIISHYIISYHHIKPECRVLGRNLLRVYLIALDAPLLFGVEAREILHREEKRRRRRSILQSVIGNETKAVERISNLSQGGSMRFSDDEIEKRSEEKRNIKMKTFVGEEILNRREGEVKGRKDKG